MDSFETYLFRISNAKSYRNIVKMQKFEFSGFAKIVIKKHSKIGEKFLQKLDLLSMCHIFVRIFPVCTHTVLYSYYIVE